MKNITIEFAFPHWEDIFEVIDKIEDLRKEHGFAFNIQSPQTKQDKPSVLPGKSEEVGIQPPNLDKTEDTSHDEIKKEVDKDFDKCPHGKKVKDEEVF